MSLCSCAARALVKGKGKGRAAALLHSSARSRRQPAAGETSSRASPAAAVAERPAAAAAAANQESGSALMNDEGSYSSSLQTKEDRGKSALTTDGGGITMDDDTFRVLERRRRLLLMDSLEGIGSSQTRDSPHNWQPHHSLSRSVKPASLTLSHLLASTAHLGHSTSLSSPMAFPYIYGTRHGVSIIDVRETLTALRRAASLVRSTVENDGIVLFLGGGMRETERVLAKNAAKMGRNGYATNKWMPGTLTNSSRLFSESSSLIAQSGAVESSEGEDRARPDKKVNASHLHPSLMVLFSPLSTPNALREANSLNIPTIALCDSNVDPRHFTYPIPCNDDSVRVAELISGVLAEAGKEGIARREAKERMQQDQRVAVAGHGGNVRYHIEDVARSVASQSYRFPEEAARP